MSEDYYNEITKENIDLKQEKYMLEVKLKNAEDYNRAMNEHHDEQLDDMHKRLDKEIYAKRMAYSVTCSCVGAIFFTIIYYYIFNIY